MKWENATINAEGTQLTYLDSGSVEGNSYTTIVIVHGHTCHAGVFANLLPLAPARNLRIIAINRRDYVGSTLFTPEELAQLNSSDAQDHKAFLRDRGLELAQFIAWFIKKHDIPKAAVIKDALGETKKAGGVAVIGWSSGNHTTLAFLRYLNTFPPDIVSALEPYVKTQIIYEPAFFSLGYPPPSDFYIPLRDPDIPDDQKEALFAVWISSYFPHPDLASRNISGLHQRIPESPRRPATTSTLTMEQLLAMTDASVGPRSEMQFDTLWVGTETMHEMAVGALWEPPPGTEVVGCHDESQWLLPEVKVGVVWCQETLAAIVLGAWGFEDEKKEREAKGGKGRQSSVVALEQGNHMLHWDEPEKTLRVFSEVIRGV